MRTLTSNAQTERAKLTGAEPILILKIAFGGAIGTRYFSDQKLGSGDASSALNAAARLVAYGSISCELVEGQNNPVGDWSVRLSDHDGVLKGYFDDVELQRKQVTLYQHFEGNAAEDLEELLVGIVNEPVCWREGERLLELDVTDVSLLHNTIVGTVATRDDYEYIAPEHEGKVLPICFGTVKGVEPLGVKLGYSTTLARPIKLIINGSQPTTLYVTDSSRFAHGEAIDIRVGTEVMEGSFSGNTFTITQRGKPSLNSTVTEAVNFHSFIDETLPATTDNAYKGLFIYKEFPDQDPPLDKQWFRIVGYVASEKKIVYQGLFVTLDDEWSTMPFYQLQQDDEYSIGTPACAHAAGEEVSLVLEEYVYVVSDTNWGQAASIFQVEAWGTIEQNENAMPVRSVWNDNVVLKSIRYTTAMDRNATSGRQGWVPIPDNLFDVDTSDEQFGVGHPQITISFSQRPCDIDPRYRTNRLRVVLSCPGLSDDAPDDAFTLLAYYQGNSLVADTTDVTGDDRVNWLHCAFALTEQRPLIDVLADLAFQAGCIAVWRAGTLYMELLENEMPAADATITKASDIVLDSVEVTRVPLNEVVTKVIAKWHDGDEEQALTLTDNDAVTLYGSDKHRELTFWAFQDRARVAALAQFWLNRWARAWEIVELTCHLTKFELERSDVVSLDWSGLFASGQKGRVIAVDHRPGSGVEERPDMIRYRLKLPIHAACSGTCETTGEADGGCTTYAEAGCTATCMTSCQGTCDGSCQTGCQVASDGPCVFDPMGFWDVVGRPPHGGGEDCDFGTLLPCSEGYS